jgi:small redox-active disulfide protein 2
MLKIQVLGTGCPKCKKLAENAEMAANDLGLDYHLEKVTDINEIMKFKVWQTPSLVVNGEVKSAGKVLTMEEIRQILERTEGTSGA